MTPQSQEPQPTARPDKRRKYDDTFRAHALQLAQESRSTARAARALGIAPKLLYLWQQQSRQPAPGSPPTAPETPQERHLRQQVRRLEQEVEILKKALIILSPKTL